MTRVAVVSRPDLSYPAATAAPFDPPNPVYAAVESLFRELGLDSGRVGSPEWNPLGDLIAPGERVAIKPNFVTNRHFHEVLRGETLDCSSTHGSVLRPVLDYAIRAAGPRGRVEVVDTPVEGCDLEAVVEGLGVRRTIEHLRSQGAAVSLIDLRHFRVVPRMALDDLRRAGRSLNLGLLIRRRLSGDPRGYRVIRLRDDSAFDEVRDRWPRLRFHRSHPMTPLSHHGEMGHEYSIPRTVLEADVIINLPKLKTHKKTGVTMALKSVIGLSNEKYWLPHYTAGAPPEGGDEYPARPGLAERLEARLSRYPLPGDHSLILRAPKVGARVPTTDGSWQGNDTVWRTIVDLNRILFYADRMGQLQDAPQRRMLVVCDGIVAGEGEGPLGATPRRSGLLMGGTDPVLVDFVAARAMGFDHRVMPMLRRPLAQPLLPTSRLDDLEVVRDGPEPVGTFRPPRAWPGLISGGA